MRTDFNAVNTTGRQRTFALAGLFVSVAIAWFISVPQYLKLSTFVALVGVVAAFAWIVKAAYVNAQPASSLAQALHDADAGALERATKVR